MTPEEVFVAYLKLASVKVEVALVNAAEPPGLRALHHLADDELQAIVAEQMLAEDQARMVW